MQKMQESTTGGTIITRRNKKNSIIKIINGMPLTFVLVYCEYAMFAYIIGKYVIVFNNNLV